MSIAQLCTADSEHSGDCLPMLFDSGDPSSNYIWLCIVLTDVTSYVMERWPSSEVNLLFRVMQISVISGS